MAWCSLRREIVLLRTGAFIRHDASGKFRHDANTVLFFNAGHPITSATLCPGATAPRCSASAGNPARFVCSLDPSAERAPGQPFACRYAVLQALQLIQYGLSRPDVLNQADIAGAGRSQSSSSERQCSRQGWKTCRETCRPGCHRQGA